MTEIIQSMFSDQVSFYYWFLISFYCGQRIYFILFLSFKTYWDLSYGRVSLMQEGRKFKKKTRMEVNEIQNRKTKEKKSIKPNVDSLKDQQNRQIFS